MFLSPLVALALCVPVAPEGLVGRIGSGVFRSPVDGHLLLDSDDFAEREAATKALAKWGRNAEDALRAALRTHESPEVRERMTELLNRSVVEVPTPEDRRAIRAVEAVEWIDTPASRELLKAWAAGAAGARLTRDAVAAIARMK